MAMSRTSLVFASTKLAYATKGFKGEGVCSDQYPKIILFVPIVLEVVTGGCEDLRDIARY